MSRFTNYYYRIEEDINIIVDEVINEIKEEMEESGYGWSLFNWLSRNERQIQEFNNHLVLSLRDSVEIIEQSERVCNDEDFYGHGKNPIEQIKNMAYWTYRNDIQAEFEKKLKNRIDEELKEYEVKALELQKNIHEVEEKIADMENILDDLQAQMEEALEQDFQDTIKILEETIANTEQIKEEYQNELEKLEEDIEKPTNFIENAYNLLN